MDIATDVVSPVVTAPKVTTLSESETEFQSAAAGELSARNALRASIAVFAYRLMIIPLPRPVASYTGCFVPTIITHLSLQRNDGAAGTKEAIMSLVQ
jgi:hypothetical protein